MSNETTIVGPYTLDLSGHWVMTNIGIYREVEHFDLPSQAKIVCEELNAAYRAGQASREQQAHPQTEDLEAMVQAYLLSKDLLALDERGIPMQEDYEGNFYKQLLMGFALSLSTSKGVEALPVSEPVAWMQPNGPVISGAIYRRWSGATGSEEWLLAKKYTIPLYARLTKE